MINLFTGLPGNGKTLYAIATVKEWAEKDHRPVFYAGINGLTLPWTPIEAEKWYEAPPGSIVVIDECQSVFRPRALGKEPPEYVSRLETHRHQGIDLVLITQHPMLCDNAIRRLTGRHLHIVRKWGTQTATIHEWPQVRENCDKPAGRRDSIKQGWKYPKAVYSFYKSAELHTVKRRIPPKVYMMFVLPIFIGALAWTSAHFLKRVTKPAGVQQQSAPGIMAGQGTSSQGQPRDNKPSYRNAVDDAKQFAFDRAPRVYGLEHTAPRYDTVTQPTTAPIPAACVASKTRCQCYSQQATALPVLDKMCRQIAANGFFIDFDPDKGRSQQAQQQNEAERPVMVASAAVPLSQVQKAPVADSGDDEDGFGPLGRHGPGVRDWQKESQPSRSAPKSSSSIASGSGLR